MEPSAPDVPFREVAAVRGMSDALEFRTAYGVVTSIRTWVETHTHLSGGRSPSFEDPSNSGFCIDGSPHSIGEDPQKWVSSTLWLDIAVQMDSGGGVPIRLSNPSFTAISGHRLCIVYGRAASDQRWSLVAFQNLNLQTTTWFDGAVTDLAHEAARASSSGLLAFFERLGGPWHTISFAACGFALSGLMVLLLCVFFRMPLYLVSLTCLTSVVLAATANAKALKILEPKMSLVCDRVIMVLTRAGETGASRIAPSSMPSRPSSFG
jgi:hypothetical protein